MHNILRPGILHSLSQVVLYMLAKSMYLILDHSREGSSTFSLGSSRKDHERRHTKNGVQNNQQRLGDTEKSHVQCLLEVGKAEIGR